MTQPTTIANRLSEALAARGLSQAALARRLDVRAGTVNEWLNRDRIPSGELMLQLPEALGVCGHWLLTGEGPRDPPCYGAVAAVRKTVEGDALRRGVLRAALAGRAAEILDLALGAIRGGYSLPELYVDVLQWSLYEVGGLWSANEVTIAEEHLATGTVETVLGRLSAALARRSAGDGPLVVAACPAPEQHRVGLRMVCDLLALEGWKVLELGARVPVEALATMVRERKPAAVALSASVPTHLSHLRAAVEAVREASGGRRVLIAVGGQAVGAEPARAKRLGADVGAGDAVEAVERVRALAG